MNRAALYVRVSTDEQVQNGASLVTQESRCRAYCQSRGWKVTRVYRDDGYSAKNLKRPALQAMLADAKIGAFTVMVVYRVDRLTRRLRDLLELTDTKHSTALVSVNESFDTTTPAGRAMLSLLGTFAQFERENTVARITDALRHRKENGRVYGVTPLGFDRKGNRLVPNLKEQMIVRRIFVERKKGRTLGAIAEKLNRDHVRTKQGKGNRWWASTVSSVLKNDIHAGVGRRGGTRG